MAGLSIQQQRNLHLGRWFSLALLLAVLIVTGYWTFKWYTTGEKPPLIPLPATAYADPSVDETPVSDSAIDKYTVPANHPRYISIPALGIGKTRVMTVGLTKLNTLDTPRNISDTAWYENSATPGQGYGQVVIDGHSGGASRDGVFVNLGSLKSGDEIIVERGDGKKITYKVAQATTMSLKETNATGMQELLKPYDQGKEGLGLITCAGKWIPRDKVFDQRILVWAVVEDTPVLTKTQHL